MGSLIFISSHFDHIVQKLYIAAEFIEEVHSYPHIRAHSPSLFLPSVKNSAPYPLHFVRSNLELSNVDKMTSTDNNSLVLSKFRGGSGGGVLEVVVMTNPPAKGLEIVGGF